MSFLTKAKLSIKDKKDKANEKFKTKYPNMHEKASGHYEELVQVWRETFPSAKSVTKDKFDKRRERAKIAKEWEDKMATMTQEEIDAMEAEIPEWKKGALVLQDDEEEE